MPARSRNGRIGSVRPSEESLRSEIVRYGKILFDKDFAPATSGNISARLDERRILITPTGVSKGAMAAEDMVIVDLDGRKLSGRGQATSELEMHQLIYAVRPDAEAVVHSHPPTATGFACAGIPLDRPLASEFVLALGCAPLAPYGTPGTGELPETLRGLVAEHDAVLMANHGVVTFGKDLFDAFGKMELVEHFARVALVVRQLGRESPLKESDVLKLLEGRARYFGLDSVPARQAGCPAPGAPSSPPQEAAPADSQTLTRIIREVLGALPPGR